MPEGKLYSTFSSLLGWSLFCVLYSFSAAVVVLTVFLKRKAELDRTDPWNYDKKQPIKFPAVVLAISMPMCMSGAFLVSYTSFQAAQGGVIGVLGLAVVANSAQLVVGWLSHRILAVHPSCLTFMDYTYWRHGRTAGAAINVWMLFSLTTWLVSEYAATLHLIQLIFPTHDWYWLVVFIPATFNALHVGTTAAVISDTLHGCIFFILTVALVLLLASTWRPSSISPPRKPGPLLGTKERQIAGAFHLSIWYYLIPCIAYEPLWDRAFRAKSSTAQKYGVGGGFLVGVFIFMVYGVLALLSIWGGHMTTDADPAHALFFFFPYQLDVHWGSWINMLLLCIILVLTRSNVDSVHAAIAVTARSLMQLVFRKKASRIASRWIVLAVNGPALAFVLLVNNLQLTSISVLSTIMLACLIVPATVALLDLQGVYLHGPELLPISVTTAAVYSVIVCAKVWRDESVVVMGFFRKLQHGLGLAWVWNNIGFEFVCMPILIGISLTMLVVLGNRRLEWREWWVGRRGRQWRKKWWDIWLQRLEYGRGGSLSWPSIGSSGVHDGGSTGSRGSHATYRPCGEQCDDAGHTMLTPIVEAAARGEVVEEAGMLLAHVQPEVVEEGGMLLAHVQPEEAEEAGILLAHAQPEVREEGGMLLAHAQPAVREEGGMLLAHAQPEEAEEGGMLLAHAQPEVREEGGMLLAHAQPEVGEEGGILLAHAQPEVGEEGGMLLAHAQAEVGEETGILLAHAQPEIAEEEVGIIVAQAQPQVSREEAAFTRAFEKESGGQCPSAEHCLARQSSRSSSSQGYHVAAFEGESDRYCPSPEHCLTRQSQQNSTSRGYCTYEMVKLNNRGVAYMQARGSELTGMGHSGNDGASCGERPPDVRECESVAGGKGRQPAFFRSAGSNVSPRVSELGTNCARVGEVGSNERVSDRVQDARMIVVEGVEEVQRSERVCNGPQKMRMMAVEGVQEVRSCESVYTEPPKPRIIVDEGVEEVQISERVYTGLRKTRMIVDEGEQATLNWTGGLGEGTQDVLVELLQNADDAGATRAAFLLDTSYPTNSTLAPGLETDCNMYISDRDRRDRQRRCDRWGLFTGPKFCTDSEEITAHPDQPVKMTGFT